MKFNNLPIMAQIVAPVLIAVFLFAASTILSDVLLREAKSSGHVSLVSSDNVAKLMSAQRNVYRIRMASASAFYGEITWDEARKQFGQLSETVKQRLSQLDSADGVLAINTDLKDNIINALNQYGVTQTVLAERLSSLHILSASLPDLNSALSRANNEFYTSHKVMSFEQRQEWRDLLSELYLLSSQIQQNLIRLERSANTEYLNKIRLNLESFEQSLESFSSNRANLALKKVLMDYEKQILMLEDGYLTLTKDINLIGEQGTLLREMLSTLSSELEEKNKQSLERGITLTNTTETALVSSSILAALIALILAVWIAKHLNLSIRSLSETIDGMSSGVLSQKANVSGNNEIGRLGANTDKTLEILDQTVSELRGVGSDVASSATQLASTMVELEGNALEQKAQIERIASTSTELAASSEQVASTANGAETYARQGIEIAKEGASAAEARASLSDELLVELNQTSQVARSLEQLSTRVTEFVSLIENVAEQTNLLALNAAIEAARAGESGRGFAVVADEVRVLAQKTSNNTESIQELVRSLQDGSQDMVTSVSVCLGKVTENATLAKQSEEDMNSLLDGITKIIDQNNEMSLAANEQSQAIASMNDNIHQIDESLSQNVQGIKQSAEAASFLSELSERQQGQLSFFKST
ncbi:MULTISPECIES: methyl-accepting chemotaxis protein [Vibrio]|uniref:Methyl-accepting chemotaxis protein n=1 Tax=Vibrio neptunius TaxID=170651 RepID=A0ABS3A1X0_9VIBR|nr:MULTISPECIES: methyl-accepting chemotaxis protein [Vibrio]MBN3493684.1 methyl-accepting chemotaxis protein [Vibrio neptunius]MBN3516085.1 methyl-accepting chemotaxis protein [Vibrio neptunius]MBN3550451.1 methyl-accepting chemotaxis protein [Vibrio neptunius]MBN3578485.1 methyl-accepting chemotaxis protein [Vibrio neptunius]MCH9872149.1 methyl-accepting chemotaxis protein [Vibrio neptunius]